MLTVTLSISVFHTPFHHSMVLAIGSLPKKYKDLIIHLVKFVGWMVKVDHYCIIPSDGPSIQELGLGVGDRRLELINKVMKRQA